MLVMLGAGELTEREAIAPARATTEALASSGDLVGMGREHLDARRTALSRRPSVLCAAVSEGRLAFGPTLSLSIPKHIEETLLSPRMQVAL